MSQAKAQRGKREIPKLQLVKSIKMIKSQHTCQKVAPVQSDAASE